MALATFHVSAPEKVVPFFGELRRTRRIPDKVTTEFLRDLGAGSRAPQFRTLLRALGFVTDGDQPTSAYRAYCQARESEARRIMADALANLYDQVSPELLPARVLRGREATHGLFRDVLRLTGSEAQFAEETFEALFSLADWSEIERERWLSHVDAAGPSPARRGGRIEIREDRSVTRGEEPSAGDLLDSYVLLERLGQGHSATVWKALVKKPPNGVQVRAGEEVALKIYQPALLTGPETIRIQTEFRVVSKINHPVLARVHDVMIAPSRPWHTFLVMEYVNGPTLKEHISQGGPLPAPQVVRVGLQLLAGLIELHGRSALHRDVKAANIIVVNREEPQVKLLDFGILSVESDHTLTRGSAFLGSKHSSPLEQLTGKPLDQRTDIYGVGSVLFHCYFGRPPYAEAGPEGAIVERMLRSPAMAESKSPGDQHLVGFINRCIAVESASRFSTAKEARAAAERLSI